MAVGGGQNESTPLFVSACYNTKLDVVYYLVRLLKLDNITPLSFIEQVVTRRVLSSENADLVYVYFDKTRIKLCDAEKNTILKIALTAGHAALMALLSTVYGVVPTFEYTVRMPCTNIDGSRGEIVTTRTAPVGTVVALNYDPEIAVRLGAAGDPLYKDAKKPVSSSW